MKYLILIQFNKSKMYNPRKQLINISFSVTAIYEIDANRLLALLILFWRKIIQIFV